MTEKERNRFVALAFCRADMLFELDDDRAITFCAGAVEPLFGSSPEKLTGTSFLDLIEDKDRTLADQFLGAASKKGRMDDVVLRLKAQGKLKPTAVMAGYRNPDFGNDFFLALKVESASARSNREADLTRNEESALLEKASYSGVAAERIKALAASGGQAKVTMVKVDRLKDLSDKLEPPARTGLLASIGNILNGSSLGGDTASQMEDDSFSFIHTDDVNPDTVSDAIEKAAKDAHPDGAEVYARSHTLDTDGEDMSEEQLAKVIIYTMQNFCENDGTLRATTLSDELQGMVTHSMENIAMLKRASSDGDFDLHFMPICDLRRKEVRHFEALSRFRKEEMLDNTYHLIRLAEETELILDYDMAVVNKAVKLIKKFSAKHPLPPVAVNISGLSINNPAFIETLLANVEKEQDLATMLMFEITESARIENLPEVNEVLQKFRKMGFRVCLDDFGAGAAGFDYLNALDVDVVKFDGPVITRASVSKKGTELLTAMAKVCNEFKIKTVAEMVEDTAMANHVYYCGLDYGQGWYFGKPSADPFEFIDRFPEEYQED